MVRPKFPKSLPEFMRLFPDERACFDYLVESRWPGGGFVCPSCGHGAAYPRQQRLAVECSACRTIVTATSGTAMHKSKQPLLSWLLASWLMVVDKRGVSASQLQRALALKRYETAFMMLHKLRAAMVAPDRTLLSGVVEVDETYIGGERKGRGSGNFKGDKSIVVGAVEVNDRAPGRIRFRVVEEGSGPVLRGFVKDTIAPGSTVMTDGASMYKTLEGYRHEVQIAGKGRKPREVLEDFHTAVTNLKSWLQGTFHGAVSPGHLQAYLNEFCFRYNRRHNLPAAFQTLLGITPKVEGPTYAGIYTGSYLIPNSGRRTGKKSGDRATTSGGQSDQP